MLIIILADESLGIGPFVPPVGWYSIIKDCIGDAAVSKKFLNVVDRRAPAADVVAE